METCVHTLLPAYSEARVLALSLAVTLSRRGAEGRAWGEWRQNNPGTSLQQCFSPSRMGSAHSPHPAPGTCAQQPRVSCAESCWQNF